MNNFNFIFNESLGNNYPNFVWDKTNQFIINSNNITKINKPSDIIIDYNVLFSGILNISNFEELNNILKNNENEYEYQFKIFIFYNFLKNNKNNIKKEIPMITNIIYQFFNVKNKEISSIFKSLKNKKNVIEFIEKTYL
jgi:hypothetical protein